MTKSENYKLNENTAKVIFKNSNNTVCTYSKTCSGASQFCTKSLILQLKQNYANNDHYEDNGSTKRDLSIETDYCILRTHFKKKLFTNRDAVSQKSKYSMNRNEIDTIHEHNRDSSACGDNYHNFLENTNLNINLTSLVVANLKNLLNDWIKSYLLENNDTKEKIESVLDSILHQLDLQRNDTPSTLTYTLDAETDKNHHRYSDTRLFRTQNYADKSEFFKCKNENSSLTIPLSGKQLKIISTLSLPRNMHNMRNTKNSLCKNRKFRHKRILVSSNNSSVYILNSTNLDFLILRTNSLVKHCATYREDKEHKDPKNNMKTKNSNIYKHIACLNILSDSKSKIFCKKKSRALKKDNINVGTLHNNMENGSHQKAKSNYNKHVIESGKKQNKRSTCTKRISSYRYPRYFKSKKLTSLLKQSNNKKPVQKEKELLQQIQNIFRYFSNIKSSNNLKLDIKVNIYPSQEKGTDDNINTPVDQLKIDDETKIPDTILTTQEISSKPSKEETKPTFDDKKNIISLLDSAASVTKYIKTTETLTNVSNKQNTEDILIPQNVSLIDSKVARDIRELKTIVHSLATVTENLITKHIEKKIETKIELPVTDEKTSKSVQFSNKSQIISGLKLRKEPRRKPVREYNPRLIKKTLSYNLINSESVLKVTDMTSTAEYTTATVVDEALTCSLPKSKSLFEVSVGSEKKLLAFYCDDYIHYSGYARQGNASYISIPCRNTLHHIRPSYILKYSEDCMNATCTNKSFEPDLQCMLCNAGGNCSSVCIDIENSCEGETVKGNRRFSFTRGFILGAVLWVPLTLLLCLLYFYVIKDLIYPPKSTKANQYNIFASKLVTNSPSYTFDMLGF